MILEIKRHRKSVEINIRTLAVDDVHRELVADHGLAVQYIVARLFRILGIRHIVFVCIPVSDDDIVLAIRAVKLRDLIENNIVDPSVRSIEF